MKRWGLFILMFVALPLYGQLKQSVIKVDTLKSATANRRFTFVDSAYFKKNVYVEDRLILTDTINTMGSDTIASRAYARLVGGGSPDSSLYVTVTRLADTASAIRGAITGGGIDTLRNLPGAGVALYKEGSGDSLKRLKAGYGLDATDNTDSVTVAVDTSEVATPYDISLKANTTALADTADSLRAELADTSSTLRTLIGTKADTSARMTGAQIQDSINAMTALNLIPGGINGSSLYMEKTGAVLSVDNMGFSVSGDSGEYSLTLGDYDGNYNGTSIGIDDNAQRLYLNATSGININGGRYITTTDSILLKADVGQGAYISDSTKYKLANDSTAGTGYVTPTQLADSVSTRLTLSYTPGEGIVGSTPYFVDTTVLAPSPLSITDGVFNYSPSGYSVFNIQGDSTGYICSLGDWDGGNNGTSIAVNDQTGSILLSGNAWMSGTLAFGGGDTLASSSDLLQNSDTTSLLATQSDLASYKLSSDSTAGTGYATQNDLGSYPLTSSLRQGAYENDTTKLLVQDSVMGEPTGFRIRTDNTITFTDATRKFLIAATGTNFYVWSRGNRYTKTRDSLIVDSTTALHYIYYDSLGVLQQSTDAWDINSTNIAIATVYYNATTQKGLLGDERHGLQMDGATQEYVHETRGAVHVSGLAGTFAADGSTTTIASGEFYDDDFEHLISQQDSVRVFYRVGSAWKWTSVQGQYFDTLTNVPAYDNAGTKTALGVGKYSVSWIFVTNDEAYPVYVIMGQAEYNTQALAEAASPSGLSLGTLPVVEMLLCYRVVWQRNGAVITYKSATDYRKSSSGGIANYTATDHSSLSNLAYSLSGHTGFVGYTDSTTTFATPTQLGSYQLANTGFTAGSIPFIGSGGALRQNNAGLFWDSTNARLGIGTATPQQTLSLASGKDFAIYNTADEATNYERLGINYTSNVATIESKLGGSGTARSLQLKQWSDATGNATFTLNRGALPFFSSNQTATGAASATVGAFDITGGARTGATAVAFSLRPTIQQGTTNSYTALLINVTETSTGSGAKNLLDAQVGGASKFSIANDGAITGSAITRGSNAWAGTAEHDTVAITGASVNDYYAVTLTGTAAPSANDLFTIEVTATGFILHRSASGTSGRGYHWIRMK